MENSLAKIEKISFHTDSLFCPVINNEPMVIMNIVINNIGLNYAWHMSELQKSRFASWIGYIKIFSKEDGKFDIGYTISNSENSKENTTICNVDLDNPKVKLNWENLFTEIGGYEYVVLPIRKIAGWLYSINPNKVKSEIRQKLELYQNECDEILYQHFFGPMSKRKIILVEKSNIDVLLTEIEKELLKIPLYVKFVTLLSDKKRMNKMLKKVDKEALSPQGNLFEKK